MPDDLGEMPQEPQSGPDGQTEHVEEQEGEEWDPGRARALINRLRGQAKRATKELEEFRHERKKAQMSETEKVSQRLRELEAERDYAVQEVKDRSLEHAIEREASKVGFIDTDAARALLDRSQLEFDDEDRPTNVPALLKALAKNKPYLVNGTAAPAMSATNGASRAAVSGRRTFSRAEVADRDIWSKHKDEIMDAMRRGEIT